MTTRATQAHLVETLIERDVGITEAELASCIEDGGEGHLWTAGAALGYIGWRTWEPRRLGVDRAPGKGGLLAVAGSARSRRSVG